MRKLLFLILIFPTLIQAQSVLTLSDAISKALEKNHDIRVAKNTAEQADNSAHPGMAGLLPTATANLGYNIAVNNTEIEFANPAQAPISATGAGSNVLNGSVAVQYQLADGFGNFYRFDVLKMTSKQAQIQTQIAIENTVLQVADAYLAIALAQKQLEVAQQSVELSNQRLSRANDKYDYGSGGKLELLSSKVDLNTDSVAFNNAKANLENALRSFAVLLGDEPVSTFTLSEEISVNEDLDIPAITQNALESNSNLVLSTLNEDLGLKNLSIAKSTYMPSLSLQGSYSFSEQNNDVGFIIRQQNDGLNVGLSLQMGIFQGFRRKVSVDNARVALESARLNREVAINRVQRDVLNITTLYRNSLYTAKTDKISVELARENYERSVEAFTYGSISSTQLREAQLNLSRAEIRASTSFYSAKLYELQLLRLGGILLTEFGS